METKIIDYLYGEMNDQERHVFEKEMAENPDLMKAVSELSETRSFIADIQEVTPTEKVIYLNGKSPTSFWKWGLGIAASLLFLLTIFHARLELKNDGVILSFGKQEMPGEILKSGMDSSTVDALARAIFVDYSSSMDRKLRNMDSIWREDISQGQTRQSQFLQQQLANYNRRQEEQFARVMSDLQQEQIPAFAGLLQKFQIEQRKEFELLVNGMWEEWQQTRYNDLESIGDAFSNIYDDVTQNKEDTEAILVGLLEKNGL